MNHLTGPVYADLRERALRYIREELLPLEKELGLGPEDPAPRSVLRGIWQRSHALGLLTGAWERCQMPRSTLRGAGSSGPRPSSFSRGSSSSRM